MELLQSQPTFKVCNEPLDLRNRFVAQHTPVDNWQDLYTTANLPRITSYLEKFITGQHRFKNQSPLQPYYRPFTSRIIFKLLHGLEDQLNWLSAQLNGQIIYLLRHPIPVSLSREVFPRLQAYLNSDYRRHFSAEQLTVAMQIAQKGSHLQKGVLSWCLQNAPPLQQRTPDWIVLTYEQMVLDPEPVIAHLTKELDVTHPERMWQQLKKPSGTTRKSDNETIRRLSEYQQGTQTWLIEKWRDKVSMSEEEEVMQLLALFELSVYKSGEFLPEQPLWLML